jgi:serine-type D-Ala-D-Ala carboxypeptidase (penicillin-binding protein 5/6)
MRLPWFHSVAGLAAFSLLAFLVVPGPSFAAAAKPKASAAKGAAAERRSKAVPAPIQPIIGPIDTQATHAFIIEAETGAVLLDKGADERIPTASLSKVMTAYVVFDMLKQGRAKLTDELPVSETAWRTQGSKMFVPLGGHISIEDLMQGMVVQSGNDACVVLAEGLAGSQEAFVELMNQKAREIGLTNSHFANVDGLPNPDHWMTPRDLAALAIRTIDDFPEYYHYYSEKDFAFNNIKQGNRNPLLYKDIGADGLKTGHTEESGYSLLASVHRENRRVILVLNGLPTMKARAQEGERLADWAFREYNDYPLFSAGEKVDDADVWLGTEAKVPLTVGKDLVVTLPRKSRKDMKVTLAYDKPVPAPVRKGQELGKVTVAAPDIAPIEVPLFAATDVDRMGPFGRMAMTAANLIWGNRH